MLSTIYENALTTIEWPYEDHIPALHCPITGMVIAGGFRPDQDPETDSPVFPDDDKCPTLLFRYNRETGMEYVQPEIEAAIAEKKRQLVKAGEIEDEEDIDDLEVISEHLPVLGQAPLILDVSIAGLPADGTIIGLDLAAAARID